MNVSLMFVFSGNFYFEIGLLIKTIEVLVQLHPVIRNEE